MIEINGKVYRNIQEQVGKNQENIEDLDTRVTALENTPAVDAYTKAQSDAKFQTIAGMSTYATKSEIPDVSDYVPKSIDGEDVEYGINYGLSNNTPQLFGADNYGSHPCDARVQVTYDSVHINANDYNHGDNDDTYTGSIDVTDGYVDIEATDGEDTTTLRVSPSGVTVNGSPIGGGSTLYRHHVLIFKANSSTYNCECLIYADIINNSSTEITSLATILSTIAAGVTTSYGHKGILANGIIKDGSNFRTIIELEVQLTTPSVLKGLYLDTSNVYALSSVVDIPSDVEVSDAVFTL